MKRLATIALSLCLCLTALAQSLFSPDECQGSYRPYPAPQQLAAYPDSLVPVLINHVGRHGSRYPSSSKFAETMLAALERADSLGTITPLGQQFKLEVAAICINSFGKWGDLDSLGIEEQRSIARRLAGAYPMLVRDATVLARATHKPRVVMSMYAFTQELSELGKHLNIYTSSGSNNAHTLRPFDTNKDYLDFMRSGKWQQAYEGYVSQHCPTPVTRLLGANYPATRRELQELSINEYYNLGGMQAMGMQCNWEPYLTLEEYNQLWSCFNLRQLLCRTATSLSRAPATLIDPLIDDLISTTDRVLAGRLQARLILRFAHAETIMPLLSELRIAGCHYDGTDWAHAAQVWQSFRVTPMGANVQFIIFKSKVTGRPYVRLDFNERPIPLIEGDARLYLPWEEARDHMLQCMTYRRPKK